ncbi:MAG: ATPase [Candidatus Desulfofervidaceae bacterium]|nr:ATPase [Candidatus Desulfofervidaceae bacterium]
MAQRGIREYDAKRLLAQYLKNYMRGLSYNFRGVLVTPETDWAVLERNNPWLKTEKLVAKPDQLFGKRGKHGLVLVNASLGEVKSWIGEKMGKKVTIGKVTDVLNCFLVEPFVAHEKEYYLAITTEREGDRIYMSAEGGIEIEEMWEKVKEAFIPILVNKKDIPKIIKNAIPKQIEEKQVFAQFVEIIYNFFVDYHFTYLEFNPFTIKHNLIYPLDAVARLDDTAQFECADKWGDIEFPTPFGRKYTAEEAYIKQLDAKSGSSLKLTVLNPHGRIWTMVAGGGASVVYTDTISDLGAANELGNYGEYSGNPTTDETYEYAKTILDLMTREKDPKRRPKILIIGGGIANFTDVAKTFDGIIKALEDYREKLRAVNAKIYVRRGGPNYEKGLARIKEAGERLGLPIEVYGPEAHMTRVVKLALEEKAA